MTRAKIVIGSFVALVAALAVATADVRPAAAHAANTDPNVLHGCTNPSGVLKLVGVSGSCSPSETPVHFVSTALVDGLQAALAALQAQVASLQASVDGLLTYIRVENRDLNGLGGPHVIVEGANFHVRSGSGVTQDDTNLGNLIVGYNDPRFGGDTSNRTGSHNLVVGPGHQYTASGGFVAGFLNTATGDFASVSGGQQNTASAFASSVSGGRNNTASGFFSSVSGGLRNAASGDISSVSGGSGNTASGFLSSVSGGELNTASGVGSSVSGGGPNTASGGLSSITGGQRNTASGGLATVSGGVDNTASGSASSVSGGARNTAGGSLSSVSGGLDRIAPGSVDWAAGSLSEDF